MGRLPFSRKRGSTIQPSRSGRLPGEENPDQGRGPSGTDGGARRAKKSSWGTLTAVSRSPRYAGPDAWISSGAGRRRPRSAPGGSSARHHRQQVLRLAGTVVDVVAAPDFGKVEFETCHGSRPAHCFSGFDARRCAGFVDVRLAGIRIDQLYS
jgi:hypothetical protein